MSGLRGYLCSKREQLGYARKRINKENGTLNIFLWEDRSTKMLISLKRRKKGGRTNVSRVQNEIANNKFVFIAPEKEK